MVKLCRVGVLAFALVVAMARPASATTIGQFDYDVIDFLGLLDFTFTVQNFSESALASAGDFTNVVVHLRQSGSEVDTINLPDVTADALNSLQQAPFLPSVLFDSAVLTFNFVDPITQTVIAGTISPSLLLIDGIDTSVEQHMSLFIDFTPLDTTPPSSPVPEPATLLTTFVGASLALARRRRSGRR